jgi:putrescine transport system substrate-binding protein
MQNEWVKWLKQKIGKATNRCHPRVRPPSWKLPQNLTSIISLHKKTAEVGKMALKAVEKVTPYIKDFTANTDRVVRELSTGESCLVQLWSSDALLAQRQMKDQKNDMEMGYVVPKEWPGLWIDMLCIPKNAPHPDHAHRFINFILRPEIAAQIVQKNLIAVPNNKVKDLLPKDLQENPMIFIPDDALEKLRIQAPLSFKDERKVMCQWMHLKLVW